MNNWRLLLLAVVVVVQPIGSFTESNLIDGRECCERTEDVRVYGSGRRSLDGNREDRRTIDERRLKLFDESRGRRYERSLSRSERLERRLSLESSRYPKDQAFSRATSRKIREDLSRNRDESRSSVGQVERDSRESRSRDALDTTRSVRLSSDALDGRSIRQSRDSVSRLPIRNSRDLEDRKVSGRDAAAHNREREVVARSSTRRDTRLTGVRSDSRIHLENNRDRRAFDRNTQADRENQRFSNVRDTEIEARMSNGRNHREAVRAELRRQRDIEFRARMITNNRDTSRIRDSRDDSERVTRNRMDARIDDRIERRGHNENRRFMDTLRNTDERRLSSDLSRGSEGTTSTRIAKRIERRLESQDRLWETRDTRLTRKFERNMRDERSSINRDETSDVRRQQRENRRATVSTDRTTSLHRGERNGNDIMLDSGGRLEVQRDNSESLDERRQQRDNTRQTRERYVELNRDRLETGRTEKSRRTIRHSSEERRIQRDRILSSRNQQSRESSDLRRRVLERGMERAIWMGRSAERRHNIREISISRSVEYVRDVTRTISNKDEHRQTRDERQQRGEQERTIKQRINRNAVSTQRLVTHSPRTENTRIERPSRNRNDVRRTDERDMTERVVVRSSRNVESSQRLASSESRKENIRHERLVKSRAEVTESERREVRRDDSRFDRRSSERVQAERRQDNRDARNEISRNREVRIDERLDSRRERDVFSRGSERGQDDREAARPVREKIVRNLNGLRIISERQQESPERHSRDIRGEARIVKAERREGKRITRDSRDVRDESNLEARRMLTHSQDNHDARVVRDETRGHRGDTRRSMITLQRNSRVAERLNERESRSGTQNERMTRNIEWQNQRDSDNRRGSRIDMRSNAVRIETSRIPLRDERILKHQGGSRNVDVISDFVETEEPVANWTLAFYTLQGIYLCGLLVQMLTENGSKTKKR